MFAVLRQRLTLVTGLPPTPEHAFESRLSELLVKHLQLHSVCDLESWARHVDMTALLWGCNQ